MLSPRGQAVLEAKILSSASASKICPRPRIRPRPFVLGLSSNFLFWPRENVCNAGIGNFDSHYQFHYVFKSKSWHKKQLFYVLSNQDLIQEFYLFQLLFQRHYILEMQFSLVSTKCYSLSLSRLTLACMHVKRCDSNYD